MSRLGWRGRGGPVRVVGAGCRVGWLGVGDLDINIWLVGR
jgi:hypothetical protein